MEHSRVCTKESDGRKCTSAASPGRTRGIAFSPSGTAIRGARAMTFCEYAAICSSAGTESDSRQTRERKSGGSFSEYPDQHANEYSGLTWTAEVAFSRPGSADEARAVGLMVRMMVRLL